MRSFRHMLIGIICLILIFCLQSVQALTFVQVADTQFGMGEKRYQGDVATFKRAITQINMLKPELVVICGDLVNNWTPEAADDFAACAKEFAMPWYATPGNHDNWKSAEFTRIFHTDHRVVEKDGVTFITLNSNLWRETDAAAADTQLAWLEQSLKDAAAKQQTIIIAAHHPLFVKAVDEPDSYDNTPTTWRAKILSIFEQYHVAAYLTGHLHYSVVGFYHGTALVTTASTAKNFSTEPLGFRVWHVDGKGYLTQEYLAVKAEEEKIN